MANYGSKQDASDSDEYLDTDFNDVESDSEAVDDLRLLRRNSSSKSRRTNSFIGADGLLSLSKRHSSSNLSMKSDCDSCATLSADESCNEDVQVTDVRLNPLLAAQQANQQRVPSFLISANAPTINKPAGNIPIQDLTTKKSASPLTNPGLLTANQQMAVQFFNQQLLAQQQQIGQLQGKQQQLPPAAHQLLAPGQQGNENTPPTCVRDLIYKAIDISLQSPQSGMQSSARSPRPMSSDTMFNSANLQASAANLSIGHKKQPPSNPAVPPSAHSNVRSAYDLSNYRFPYAAAASNLVHGLQKPSDFPLNLQNSHNSQQMLPLNLKASPASSLDNYADEVQDLSKKTGKKETTSYSNDYDQPKNLSLKPAHTKSARDVSPINLQMPPPAHSNYYRTQTPGLDSVNDLSRQRESPQKPPKSIYPPPQSVPPNLLGRVPTPNFLNQMQRLTPNSQRLTPTSNPRSTPNSAARLTPTNQPPPSHKNSPSPQHLIKPSPIGGDLQFAPKQTPPSIKPDPARSMYAPAIGGSIVHGMPVIHQGMTIPKPSPYYQPNSSPSPIHSIANLTKTDPALLRPMSAQPTGFSIKDLNSLTNAHPLGAPAGAIPIELQNKISPMHQLVNLQHLNVAGRGMVTNPNTQELASYMSKKPIENANNLNSNQLLIDFTTSKFMRQHQDNLNSSLNNSLNSQQALNQAIQQQAYLNSQYAKLNAADLYSASANLSKPRLPLNAVQEPAKQPQHSIPYQQVGDFL